MAPSVVQHPAGTVASFTSGTTGTATATFGTALTAGNAVKAVITIVGAATNPTIVSVTTNGAAENWVLVKQGTLETSSGHYFTAEYVNPNTGGGQTAIKINGSWAATLTGTNNGLILVDIYEVTGVAASSIVDVSSGGGSSSASTFSSGSATTTQASEIAFGGASSSDSGTPTLTGPASPWTNETKLTGTILGGAVTIAHLSGFNILTTTQSLAYSGATGSGVPNSAVIGTLFAATTNVTGTAAMTGAPDVMHAAGGSNVTGTAAMTGAVDVMHASGSHGNPITGTVAMTGAPDVMNSTGAQLPPALVSSYVPPGVTTDPFGNPVNPDGLTFYGANGQQLFMGLVGALAQIIAKTGVAFEGTPANLTTEIGGSGASQVMLLLLSGPKGNAGIGTDWVQVELFSSPESGASGSAGGTLNYIDASGGVHAALTWNASGAAIPVGNINGITPGPFALAFAGATAGAPPSGSGTAVAASTAGALLSYLTAFASTYNTTVGAVNDIVNGLAGWSV